MAELKQAPTPVHRRAHSTVQPTPTMTTTDHSPTRYPKGGGEGSDPVLLEALDLRFPITHAVNRLQALLDGSLSDAMQKLEFFKKEVGAGEYKDGHYCYGGDTDLDSETPADMLTSTDDEEGSPTLVNAPIDARFRAKRDAEMLEAFIQEAYNTLGSIRNDVRAMIPTLPTAAASFRSRFPNASAAVSMVDPRAVFESLSQSYQRANEILQQISLYSPTTTLPSPPQPDIHTQTDSLSASTATSRPSLATKRRFSVPVASSRSTSPAYSTNTAPPIPYPATRTTSDDASPPYSSLTSYALPTPPLSAIRAFFLEESAKLQAKLPSAPPMLEEWADNLSHALHDAKEYVHDEGEKLREFVADEAEKLRNALKFGAERLLHYHELPVQWRNNKYILSGYRFIPIDRPGQLLLSAVQWHNETVNIYTHFIPAMYIIYYIFYIFPSTPLGNPEQNDFVDRAINLTFLLASLTCLLLSTAWHFASGCGTFSVFHSCATLDYLGISSLISSSILTLTHQGFRCRKAENLGYNLTTCLFGALGLYLPWQEWFNKRQNKNYRIAFFLGMSAAGAAPLIHFAWIFGIKDTWQFYSPVLYSLISYLLGLMFYAFDFPEIARPGGLFDTLFHSHQLWHCAIVAAIALHWWALTTMSEKGLLGYSCAPKDTSMLQQISNMLLHREEL